MRCNKHTNILVLVAGFLIIYSIDQVYNSNRANDGNTHFNIPRRNNKIADSEDTTFGKVSLEKEVPEIEPQSPIAMRTQTLFDDVGNRCGVLLGNKNYRNNNESVALNTAPSNAAHILHKKDHCATSFGRTWGEYLTGHDALNTTFPSECLPRMVRLSSFPTAGNGVLRLLFRLNTGFFNGMNYPHSVSVSEGRNLRSEKEVKTRSKFRGKTGKKDPATKSGKGVKTKAAEIPCMNNGVDDTDPNSYLTIPYTSEELFIKKAHGLSAEENERQLLPSQCIQLIRNPGDHLIRNTMRWKSKGTVRNTNSPNKDKFIENTKTFCKSSDTALSRLSQEWNKHYREAYKYCVLDNHLPHKVVKYEHITELSSVGGVMEDLLAFVGYTPASSKLQHRVDYSAVIRVPTYTHGTLLLDACGIEFARKVNNLTQEVATEFGYQFDYEKGIWVIPS